MSSDRKRLRLILIVGFALCLAIALAGLRRPATRSREAGMAVQHAEGEEHTRRSSSRQRFYSRRSAPARPAHESDHQTGVRSEGVDLSSTSSVHTRLAPGEKFRLGHLSLTLDSVDTSAGVCNVRVQTDHGNELATLTQIRSDSFGDYSVALAGVDEGGADIRVTPFAQEFPAGPTIAALLPGETLAFGDSSLQLLTIRGPEHTAQQGHHSPGADNAGVQDVQIDSAEFLLTLPSGQRRLTLREFRYEFLGDVEFSLLNARHGTPGRQDAAVVEIKKTISSH